VGDAFLFTFGLAGIYGVRHLWRLKWHPFGRCYWCGGRGRNPGSTDDEYGFCSHCQNGRRVRIGAGIFHPELRKGARK
jgi:hypothetical protein